MAIKFTRVVGDAVTMRAATYGVGSYDDRENDRDRLSDFTRNLRERSRAFVDTTRDLLDVFYSDETRSLVRDTVSVLKGTYRRNAVQYLTDYTEIGTAPEIMRRLLVAHPRLRELVREQRCSAWNTNGSAWNLPARKEEDVFYRAVTNGKTVVPEDVSEPCYSDFEFGIGAELAEHRFDSLDIMDQIDVADTWAIIDTLMDAGIDPTSAAGELL